MGRTFRSSSVFFVCAAAAGCSAPPTDAPDLAGGPDVWEGTLRLVVHDPGEGPSSTAEYLELPDGLYVPVDRQATGLVHVEGGERVRLFGGLSGGRLAAKDIERVGVSLRSDDVAEVVVPGGTGPSQKVAVILVSLLGVTNGFDPDQIRAAFFGATGRSTQTYWKETSFGKFSVTGAVRTDGDVFGPYTISGDCSYDNVVNASAQAAQNAGVDLSVYDHVIRYTPQGVGSCAGGGEGDQPGENSIIYGLTLNYFWEYAAHEVGHNFGCGHASSYDNCAVGAFEGSCEHNEYGDETDVMGSRNGQYMSYYKDALGWLEAANKTVVTSSRQVRLYPIEQPAAGLQSVLVPRGDDSQFHLEFRQAVGYDAFLESNLTNGVLLRYLPSGRRTLPHIIDFGSTSGARDAALRPGTTFTDQNRQIKVLDVTSASALVEIVIDGKPAAGEGGMGGGGAGGVGGTAAGGASGGKAGGGMGGMGVAGGAGAGVGGISGAGGASGSGGQTQGGASGVAGDASGGAGSGGLGAAGANSGAGSGGIGGSAGAGKGGASGAGAGAAPVAGSAGSGVGGVGGATGGTSASAGAGATSVTVIPPPTTDGDDGGCSCRTAGDARGRGGAPASVAVVASLLAFVRRRRRDG